MRTETLTIRFCRKKSQVLPFQPGDCSLQVVASPQLCAVYDLCLYKTGQNQTSRWYYSLLSNFGTEEIDISGFSAARLVRNEPGVRCSVDVIIRNHSDTDFRD